MKGFVVGVLMLLVAGSSCDLTQWNTLSAEQQQKVIEYLQNVPPVVKEALNHLGEPYRWGASGPRAFDCSGLVVWSYAKFGRGLPHSSRALRRMATKVSLPAAGDLVFPSRRHVGIYIGAGYYVHSPHSGDVVRIAKVRGGASYGRVV